MNAQNNAKPKKSIFPFNYLVDFMKFVKNSDRIKMITYDDFRWEYGSDKNDTYRREYQNWLKKVEKSDELTRKISILLQFDVDGLPNITSKFVCEMMKLGVPANIMIFKRRVNRKLLAETGIVEETDYPIDDELYLKAQSQGFVVGYHSNAVEFAGHDLNKAVEIFRQDLADMRKRFPGLRYFSPHGGVRSAAGLNNNDLPYDEVVNEELGTFWVHNRNAPSFAGGYSDGGVVSRAKKPNLVNLRTALKSWRIGNRYRVLLHPQKYGGDLPVTKEAFQHLMVQESHKEIWDAYLDESMSPLVPPHETEPSSRGSTSNYWSSLQFSEEVGGFV